MATSAPPDVHTFEHHWQDEADAAYLYRILADKESDPRKKDIYSRLAEVEDRHVVVWGDLLTEHGHSPKQFRPSTRARLLAGLGKFFGPGFLLPMLLQEEGREVKAYLDMHRTESGGFLRNVVYGFNDGLTANFGLVAGVIGAAVSQQHEAVVIAGVAGLIADALSMGSSGYLAAKSEREVYDYEIAMERDEVALMPEIERDELALIYEAKGMDPSAAHALATQVMADPERMLEEQVQEELKIGEQTTTPLREGWVTGLATAFGAIIPVFPFLVLDGQTAIIASFTFSLLSHFLVGAARSVFTGRSVFRSGLDMFVVGLGVAIAGYYVGGWVGHLF